jgi:hypothetical protein
MKRPNILNKVYDAMCFRDQELFRKKLIEIGLNSRVFHENYKLDTCKINVMDLYDIMVEIVANHRQYEHPYFVLQDWLKGRIDQESQMLSYNRWSVQSDQEQLDRLNWSKS